MSLPHANKELGQHFLRDKNVIQKITSDFSDEAKYILEVGPGPGILTEHLASHQLPIKLFEMDQRFEEILEPIVGTGNIVMGDALKQDMPSLLQEWGNPEKVWMVSNLPYNISAPLTLKFLQIPSITFMTLMYQKEVAQKVVPPQMKNSMSSLFALTNTYFECRSLCKVAPGAFHPPPKVDSMVISYRRIEHPVIPLAEYEKFEKFLRTLFQFKRKQISSVLKVYKNRLAVLEKLEIPSNTRAETLNLKQVHELYKEICVSGN